MKKYILPCITLLFVILNTLVLIFSYDGKNAPVYFYICMGVLVLFAILFLLYQKILRKKLTFKGDKLLPVVYVLLVLLCSAPFLITGVQDFLARKNPSYVILSNAEFFKEDRALFGEAYYLTGMDSHSNFYTFSIDEALYSSYYHELPTYTEEESSLVQNYTYPPSAEFMAEYLPGSQKLVSFTSLTMPSSDTTETTPKHIEAQITSILDACTMQATITSLMDYSGSKIKKGDSITIQGTMTLLYPFNIQEFYELKEGDTVNFLVNSLDTENGITITTSALNLVQ